MQLRSMGNSGLELSAVSLGCMGLIGWYGERNDAEARATLLAAIDAGVNHFDTAQSYQNGANESFVGETLAPVLRTRRGSLILASKFGLARSADGGVLVDNRPAAIRAAIDLSLQRLATDYLDIYYLHRIASDVPIEDSVGELGRAVDAGKIRHIGLSECSVTTLRRACATRAVAVVQSEYSLWARDPEQQLLDACAELGVGFVAYSPLGRGFLAGEFARLEQLPAGDVRRQQPRFLEPALTRNLRLLEVLRGGAQRLGCTSAQLAIAWVLARRPFICAIPGTKRRERLQENLAATDLQLSSADCAALARQFEAIGVQGTRHPPAMMAVVDR